MSNGIGPNPLNAISKVYLDQIANEGYDKPDEKLKTDRNMFNIPKDEQQAAKERLLAKAKAKRAAKMEALDPVGKEDGDVNNDGKKDSTDSYLMKRRKAIGKAIKSKMSEGVRDMDPEKGTAERKARLEKKRGMKLDDHPEYKKEEVETVAEGDGDPCWDTHKQVGMKKKGGKMVPNCVPKTRTESFSSWRQDLSEVITDEMDDKPIKEKKVKNKITINPKLGEAVEELGGTLIEEIEVDEMDYIVESVYDELIEEGYSEDDVEAAIENAMEATVTFGHDTKDLKKDGAQVGSRRKFLKRKAGEFLQKAKKKAGMASAKAQVSAYNKGREVKQAVADKTRAKKQGVKRFIKKAAQKVVNRMSEEMSPEELALQKRRTAIDQMIARKRKQQLDKSKKEPVKTMGEGLSIDQQMKISRDAAKNRNPKPDHKAIRAKMLKKPLPKDTRTDAQKMTDATGPRPGTRYRGD